MNRSIRVFAAIVSAGGFALVAVSDPPGGGEMPSCCPPGVSCGTPKYGDCEIYPPSAAGCGETVTVCETMYGPPTGGETDCGNCFTDFRTRKQECRRYADVASLACDASVAGLTRLPCTDSDGACCWSSDPFPQNAAGPKLTVVPFGGFTCCGGSGGAWD